jgi:ribosomal protein L32
VYSKLDKKGKIIPKYVNCNNCGITHLVHELCKSDIKVGKEDITSIRKIDDIKISLPERLVDFLETYRQEIYVYEKIEDIIEQSIFPESIILKREIIDDVHHVKILNITSEKTFTVSTEVINTVIIGGS